MWTDVVLIVDRSGSMSSIKTDIEGGLDSFIEKQRKIDGEKVTVTLCQFDDEYEIVLKEKDISVFPKYELKPRGTTALLDAIGKTIVKTDERISKKDNQPDKVICVILTDGFENASKEYKRDKVFELIRQHEKDNSWKFIFLGANQDAIQEGGNFGIASGSALSYQSSVNGVKGMFGALNSGVACLRAMDSQTYNVSCQNNVDLFSEEDRDNSMKV